MRSVKGIHLHSPPTPGHNFGSPCAKGWDLEGSLSALSPAPCRREGSTYDEDGSNRDGCVHEDCKGSTR